MSSFLILSQIDFHKYRSLSYYIDEELDDDIS